MKNNILLVEDEAYEAEPIIKYFKEQNISITWAQSVSQGLSALKKQKFDLLLVDYQLPDGEGVDVLKSLHTPLPRIYMMSAFGSISRAVEAVRLGAHDFFEKPLSKHQLQCMLPPSKTLANPLPQLTGQGLDIQYSVGSPLEEALALCDVVKKRNCNVFIHGESGTGKELIAKYLHEGSTNQQKPFIEINCGAIPENLLESELFGYKKGAFTGALKDTPGKIEYAKGGTLFLDEIGDMPFFMQTKMLRVLQEKCITPLGHPTEIPVDFRLITATHKNLALEVKEGRFREDLYYRLNVIQIDLPPLRNRKKDVPLLLNNWLVGQMEPSEMESFVNEIITVSKDYTWPGNVRELKNFMERCFVLRSTKAPLDKVFTDYLQSKDVNSLPQSTNLSKPTQGVKLKNSPTEVEVMAALKRNNYVRKKTAQDLGVSLRSLQYKIARMRSSSHRLSSVEG